MAVEVTGYHIHITDDWDGGKSIEVIALVGDGYGNHIGEVSTDIYEFARNLPHALIKSYLLTRKIDKGIVVPEVNL